MIAEIGAKAIITMAVKIEPVLKSGSLDPALLETANTWFGRSWWGLMISGGTTALAACATVAFLILQFWSSNIKERFSDERISANEAETARAVADSDAAREGTAKANERIAGLNNDTARLTAENLALQTVLLPRHVGLYGGPDGPSKTETWFAGMAEFDAVSFAIQPVNDAEARNLASEIMLALAFVGIRASIDESAEGVMVSFPKGNPLAEKAGNALADALTSAGLGVGNTPVLRSGIIPPDPKDIPAGLVNPIHKGVVVAVGQRPVSQTVAWLKRERLIPAGNAATAKTDMK
jgi:hypothetical protein